METIFDHNVTEKELTEYGATYFTRKDYLQHITEPQTAYSDISSLYANRGNDKLAEKYKDLCDLDEPTADMVIDECLPYKLS